MTEYVPMSREGYEKLQETLRQLKDVERADVERALGEAREHGDLAENAEFHAARERLWEVDRRIAEAEDRLARARIVSAANVDQERVAFGATVRLLNMTYNEEKVWQLVGEGESDPSSGRIAYSSPIGQGLIGARVDEEREVTTPGGKVQYRVLEIRYE